MEDILNSIPYDWEEFERRIEEAPDDIQWVSSYKSTVLHHACRSNAPLYLVWFLWEKHSDAIRAKNKGGWLPLHLACCHGKSVAVIQFLVEAYPDALHVTNNEGKTPIQLAKKYNYQNNAGIVAYLESVTPESVKTRQAMERIASMVDQSLKRLEEDRKTAYYKIFQLSNLRTEPKWSYERQLPALTAHMHTCNKKIDEMGKEVNVRIENTLSTLTAELRTGNKNTLSAVTAELKKSNENTLSNLTSKLNTVNYNTLSSQGGSASQSEERIAAMIDKKINKLEKALTTNYKTIEADLKYAILQGVFFCVIVQIILSTTSPFLSPQWNTTSITMIDDATFFDKYYGRILGGLRSTFLIYFWQSLVFLCIGIVGSLLYIYSKHFIMICHAP